MYVEQLAKVTLLPPEEVSMWLHTLRLFESTKKEELQKLPLLAVGTKPKHKAIVRVHELHLRLHVTFAYVKNTWN